MRTLLFSVKRPELEVTYFSGHGPGGTNRNKVQNCVRIKHAPSGALVTGQEYRERRTNIRNALERLVDHPKFRAWWRKRCAEIETGLTVEQVVDSAMCSENLRIEVKKDGKWSLE